MSNHKIEIILNDNEINLLLTEGADTGVKLDEMVKRYALEYARLRHEHELLAPLIHGQLANMELAIATTLSRIAENVERIVEALDED